MEKQNDTRRRIASLTSNILNPFLLCLALIFFFSFTSTSSTPEAIKWALLSMAGSVLPVFLVIIYMIRNGRLDSFFVQVRQQRTGLYVMGCLCACISCITLAYLKAPSILVSAFATGFSTALIFTFINLWWKISLHTALVAASATVLVMLYGWAAVAAVALVPLTAWARIELEYHSPAQAVSGALLAALIVVAIFYPLALA